MDIPLNVLAAMLRAAADVAEQAASSDTTSKSVLKQDPVEMREEALAKGAALKAQADEKMAAKEEAPIVKLDEPESTVPEADTLEALFTKLEQNFKSGTEALLPPHLSGLKHLDAKRQAHYMSYVPEEAVRSVVANMDVNAATANGIDLSLLKLAGAGNTEAHEWPEITGQNAEAVKAVVAVIGQELWDYMKGKDTFPNVATDAMTIRGAMS